MEAESGFQSKYSFKDSIFIGIDIGGTLAKLCISMPRKTQLDLKFHHIEALKIEASPENDVYFLRFSTERIQELIDFIKKFDLHQVSKKFHVTGGGAYKFSDLFQVFCDFLKEKTWVLERNEYRDSKSKRVRKPCQRFGLSQ